VGKLRKATSELESVRLSLAVAGIECSFLPIHLGEKEFHQKATELRDHSKADSQGHDDGFIRKAEPRKQKTRTFSTSMAESIRTTFDWQAWFEIDDPHLPLSPSPAKYTAGAIQQDRTEMPMFLCQVCDARQENPQIVTHHESEIEDLQSQLTSTDDETLDLQEAIHQLKERERYLQDQLEQVRQESAQAMQRSIEELDALDVEAVEFHGQNERLQSELHSRLQEN
jgi:hypothetical protein